MGQRLVALGSADDELKIVAALESPNHPKLGEDAGVIARLRPIGVPLSATLTGPVDVVIDFSMPAGAMSILKTCSRSGFRWLSPRLALRPRTLDAIRAAAKNVAILWSPSMSLTVNLAMKLSEIAGRALAEHPSGADVEIIERHHRFKEDAPSGTALKFGQIIAEAMGINEHRHGREGRPGAAAAQ